MQYEGAIGEPYPYKMNALGKDAPEGEGLTPIPPGYLVGRRVRLDLCQLQKLCDTHASLNAGRTEQESKEQRDTENMKY